MTKVEADSEGEDSLEKETGKEEEGGEKMSYPGGEHQVGPCLDTDDNMGYRVQQPFSHHRSVWSTRQCSEKVLLRQLLRFM